MKLITLTLTVIYTVFCTSSHAQTVTIKATKLPDTKVVLGQYHGDNIKKLGELFTNSQGEAFFNTDTINSGLFYLALSDTIIFEFLYDRQTPGNINITYDEKFEITEAPSSTLSYFQFTVDEHTRTELLDSIRIALRQTDIKKREQKELLSLRDQLKQQERDDRYKIILEYDSLLIAKLFKSDIKVSVPDYQPPETAVNKDSATWMWQMNYYKKHYLDNVDLACPVLINTPVYTKKINAFLEKINQQSADELTKAVDFVLKQAYQCDFTAEFTTNYLLIKYNALKNNPEYELVYLHIIKDYYMQGKTPWMTTRDTDILAREYNNRFPLSLHQPAPVIDSKNEKGDDFSLYSIQAVYTILYFHNCDCEVCKSTGKELKRLMYQVDPDAVKTIAICLSEKKDCKDYAKNHYLINWVNVYDEEASGQIALDYDLSHTPTFFLLDEDKKIIAKNLTIHELKKWIEKM